MESVHRGSVGFGDEFGVVVEAWPRKDGVVVLLAELPDLVDVAQGCVRQ
nr:hypothetical protein [Streptomyces lavendulae]